MLLQKPGFLDSILSVRGWQSKQEPHLMHIMLFLLLQRKQFRYSSFIPDMHICGLDTISCFSDAIIWKYVLFLNNVFHYRLFTGYSPIGSTVSIANEVEVSIFRSIIRGDVLTDLYQYCQDKMEC
jgi:hypothetical protein